MGGDGQQLFHLTTYISSMDRIDGPVGGDGQQLFHLTTYI